MMGRITVVASTETALTKAADSPAEGGDDMMRPISKQRLLTA